MSDIGDADVGRLRGLEQRLPTERDFSEALLEAAGCLVVVLDPGGRVVRWNRACEETTGYTAADLDAVDDVMKLLIPDAEVTGARQVLADLREGRVEPVTYVNHWRARTGELHLITWSNTVVTIDGARHVIGTGIDITELEQARRALEASEERFRMLTEAVPDLIYRYRLFPHREFEYISPATVTLTGYFPEDFYADPELINRVVHPEDSARLRREQEQSGSRRSPRRARWVHRDGTIRWIEDHHAVLSDASGAPVGLEGVVRDVTEQVRAERLLAGQSHVLELIAQGHHLSETLRTLLQLLEEHLPDVLAAATVCEARGRAVIAAAPAAPEAVDAEVSFAELGESAQDGGIPIERLDLPEALRAGAAHRGLKVLWRASLSAEGSDVLGDLLVLAPEELEPDDADTLRLIARLAAVAVERHRAERALTHRALHDPLTGLANRTLLLSHLETALRRARRVHQPPVVLFCDVDRFKTVNDSLGHTGGDALLVAVADRLRSSVRPQDMVARHGGDEFIVACEALPDETAAAHLADRILAAFSSPFEIAGHLVYTSLSIGIAVATSPDDTPETLVRNADAAMYRAKERGRRRVEIFDVAMQRRAQRRWETETALHAALDGRDLEVHYQPQFDLSTGRLVGAEALLRWRHDGHLVPPRDFIPIAEESGLIGRLGIWVLEQACATAARFAALSPGFVVSVNLSARQLNDRRLVDDVGAALRASGLQPKQLCLEVTETVLMDEAPALLDTLHGLREIGLALAIDDFGTGYSSLLYLKRLPVTMLKIDGQFVRGLGHHDDDEAIVALTIQLARALNLSTTAEGVETTGQRDRLTALGCGYAQGYLLGRPGPAHDLAIHA